jgi:hypothetical protein
MIYQVRQVNQVYYGSGMGLLLKLHQHLSLHRFAGNPNGTGTNEHVSPSKSTYVRNSVKKREPAELYVKLCLGQCFRRTLKPDVIAEVS